MIKHKNAFRDNAKQQAENWGKVKFVPKVTKQARTERVVPNAATPWKMFKNELIEKQREEDTSNTIDMNSTEAQSLLKKREQNYRRMLITEKSKQPTKWESFQDDATETASLPPKPKPMLQGVNIQNFDAKKLSFKHKNDLRKALTKGLFNKGGTLKAAVKNLKLKKSKGFRTKTNVPSIE